MEMPDKIVNANTQRLTFETRPKAFMLDPPNENYPQITQII